MARRLGPEEAALWARVMASVRPLRPAPVVPRPSTSSTSKPSSPPEAAPAVESRRVKGRVPPPRPPAPSTRAVQPITGRTLDAGWDRRLARGMAAPDATIDLHGHTLASAHGLLDDALARAIARGDRVVLLVTGRPPRPESERPHARGAIRAAVTDWLAASRHADSIAAVRPAAPRHGGAGALYIVLRRGRE